MVPTAATLAFRVLCQRAYGAAGTSHHAQHNLSEQVVSTHSHTQHHPRTRRGTGQRPGVRPRHCARPTPRPACWHPSIELRRRRRATRVTVASVGTTGLGARPDDRRHVQRPRGEVRQGRSPSVARVAEYGPMGVQARRRRRRGRGRVGTHLACPPGRSRSLRAAWRPCSRGPARRAHGVTRKRQPSAIPCTLPATVPIPCTGTDRHHSPSQLRQLRRSGAVKAATR